MAAVIFALYVVALLLFALAGLNVSYPRVNLLSWGLAAFTLAVLLTRHV